MDHQQRIGDTVIRIEMPLRRAGFFDRLKLAKALMMGRPVMYRVGFENGDLYTRETIYAGNIHLSNSTLHLLDIDGTVIRPTVPWKIMKDWKE